MTPLIVYEIYQSAPLLAAGMNGQVWDRLDACSKFIPGLSSGLDVRLTNCMVVKAPLLAAGFFT